MTTPSYTLWRNGVLLGEIVVQPTLAPEDMGLITGVLRPTPAFAGTTPVVQTELVLEPGEWTQSAGKTEVVPLKPRPIPTMSPPAPPWPPSSDLPRVNPRQQPPRVLPAERLEIRRSDGTLVECGSINLAHFVPEEGYPEDKWREDWGIGGDAREAWMVVAMPPLF